MRTLAKENLELKKKLKSLEKTKSMCVICQDMCLESEENSTPCGHTFHTGCLLGWLKTHNTCPCCREELYEKEEVPEIPEISDMQNLVENVFSMHLNLNPTEEERRIQLDQSTLYNLGDEISRLSVEQALNIDIDWVIEFENDEENNEENDENYESDTNTVIVNESYEEEEKHPDEGYITDTSDMEIESPSSPRVIYDFPPLTPPREIMRPMVYPETTLFEEWENFSNVLSELRTKNRFKETQNKINYEMQKELAIKIKNAIGEENYNKFQKLCGDYSREVIDEGTFSEEAGKLLSINYLKQIWELIIDNNILPSWRKRQLKKVKIEDLEPVASEGIWV